MMPGLHMWLPYICYITQQSDLSENEAHLAIVVRAKELHGRGWDWWPWHDDARQLPILAALLIQVLDHLRSQQAVSEPRDELWTLQEACGELRKPADMGHCSVSRPKNSSAFPYDSLSACMQGGLAQSAAGRWHEPCITEAA